MKSPLSNGNVRAASLALLLFVYSILLLATFSIHYTETIRRITVERIFDESLVGSISGDALASIGLALVFVVLAFRSTRLLAISIALFVAGIVSFVAGYEQELAIAGLVTVPFLAALFLAAEILRRRNTGQPSARPSVLAPLLNLDGRVVAASFLAIIIIIEIGALARWISYPALPTEIYSDPSWRLAELESALFHSMALLSPAFLALIAFSFLYRWFIMDVLKRTHSFLLSRLNLGGSKSAALSPENLNLGGRHSAGNGRTAEIDSELHRKKSSLIIRQETVGNRVTAKLQHRAILAAALVIAPLLMVYPHLPGVNPSGIGVSTDEQYYMNWISKMRLEQNDGGSGVSAFTINRGDRPLTLLLIAAVADLTALPDITVIRYLPVALAPMLVFASYMLVRLTLPSKADNSTKTFAALAGLVAAFSPQIIVGEYAGLLANWLALIPSYFALYVLIKCWESRNRRRLVLSSVGLFGILLLVMLIHLYIWSQMLVVAVMFIGISYAFSRKKVPFAKLKVGLLLLVIGGAVAVDYARSAYFGTLSVTSSNSAITRNILPGQESASRWDQLYFILTKYVGGFLSNPVLFLLALIWVAARVDLTRGLDRAMIAMLFLIAFPLLIGTVEFQTRVIYNTPVQIPAVLALYSFAGHGRHDLARTLLILAVILVMATYGIRAMANLYLELPPGAVLDRQFLLP